MDPGYYLDIYGQNKDEMSKSKAY